MVKQYYRIGEVAKLLNIKSSVLRFWETEFSQLNPMKSSSGQRFYTKKHIDILKSIQKMLYVDKFTIGGAKKVLADKDARENLINSINESEKKAEIGLKHTIKITKDELLNELKSIRELLIK